MMRTRTPRLLAALAATTLLVTACGSDDDGKAADTVPAATDEGSDGDDGLLAPRPIEVTSGGANAAGAEAAAEPAADRATSDAMYAPYRIVTFVAGEGLPGLPTNDSGYVFQAGATQVTSEQVAAIAAQLGVEGEPRRIDEGYGVRWEVGANDGTAPGLYVYEDAMGSWYYSPAYATAEYNQSRGGGCAVAGSAGSEGAPTPAVEPASDPAAPVADDVPAETKPGEMPPEVICEEPEPPTGILSADEAEARTRELMTALGLNPDEFTIEVYADEWYASVGASEQVAEGITGRRFDAGFGAEGRLESAGGQLAIPQPVGPYPLIDLDTAIARLNDPSGFYGGYGGGIAIDAVARGEAVAAETAVADVAVAPPDVASSDVIEAPAEPPAEPEEVTVTLVDVQPDAWWAWDVDGSAWILPAYRFIGDDGGWYTVPAVTDEFLVQAPTPTTEPAQVVDPVIDTGAPTEPVPTDTPGDPGDELFDATQLEPYVGTTLIEFTRQAEQLGATVRVARQNGEDLALTMDLQINRVNVAVEGDGDTATVTEILNVG